MRRWVALPIALALAVALAGCGDDKAGANKVRLGDGVRVSLDLPPDQQPDKDDIRGAVSGIVVNDAIYPVEGAAVQVKGWNFTATTDDGGRFTFLQMPPGIFVLAVTKDAHSDGLGTINVRSGDVAKSVIMLPRLPYVAPYHRTLEIEEFYSEVDQTFSGDRSHLVALDAVPESLILEADWDDIPSAAGDPLSYAIQPEGAPPARSRQGTGPNPLRIEVPMEIFHRGEYRVRLDVDPTTAVPPESHGRIFLTAFYVEAAPDGWSFVGGDQ